MAKNEPNESAGFSRRNAQSRLSIWEVPIAFIRTMATRAFLVKDEYGASFAVSQRQTSSVLETADLYRGQASADLDRQISEAEHRRARQRVVACDGRPAQQN